MCEWANSVDSRMDLNGRRWIDSERDTAVCPFISGVHGRAQQWHLIHQPQEYYWASWNRTKIHLYPSCIPFLLFSRPQLLLSTSFAECVVLVCVTFLGKNIGVKGRRRRQCEWRKKWRVKEWNKMENDNESVWRIWVYEGGSEQAQGKQRHSSCRPNSFLTQCLCSD